MVFKDYKMKGYTLHTIKTDKFKMCHVEVIFRNNVVKEEITKRNLLFDMLCECSNSYKGKRDLALELENLYCASVYDATSKVGNSVITNFCLDFLNPRYAQDNTLTEKVFKLLFDLIFNPKASNNEFDHKLFDFVKERLANDIKMLDDNPKKKSLLKALSTLGDGPSSYGSLGFLEDLDKITPENLYTYYKQVINTDYVDIYVVGNLDMDEVSRVIDKYAKLNVIKNHEVSMYVSNVKRKPVILSDKSSNAQSNIVVLVNLNNLTTEEKKYAANMYNLILGGGSLETKLYQKLRVENSLCYNVGSMYQKYDGLIIITTSVDINKSKLAVQLIKECLKEMKSNISDEELVNAKALAKTSLNMTNDNIGRIVDNAYYQNISDLDELDIRLDKFDKVSASDIKKVAEKTSISTIYVLEGGSTNE